MDKRRKYPVGIQTFSKIREGGFLYVDKTDLVFDIAAKYQYVFLSRPRRFGKTLLLTTFQSYFEGRKELFDGLAISSLEKEWERYPTLRFDMSRVKNVAPAMVQEQIVTMLKEYENAFGLHSESRFPGERLYNLIQAANKQSGKEVVVLIDEYDAPLLDVLEDSDSLKLVRKVLQEFYTPLKACDEYLRFVFITGITKFSQVSIFSTINNLAKISMDPAYSAICGISEEELNDVFAEDIQSLAAQRNESVDAVYAALKQQYDGYHFSRRSPDIYNPFSILNVLASGQMDNYWYSSGTPSFLLKQMSHFNTDISKVDGILVPASAFDRSTDEMTDALPLLYQSGYVTIKDYEDGGYVLGIPNTEVRVGLMENLLPLEYKSSLTESGSFALRFAKYLKQGNLEEALSVLQGYFASIPYPELGGGFMEDALKRESYYETLLFVVFSFLNMSIHTQVKTAAGRADVVMSARDAVYVFEIKIDRSAADALAQIDEKGYSLPYLGMGKRVVKCGISFSTKTRTIDHWLIKE